MLSLEDIKEIDKQGLSSAYEKWPEASQRALSQPISHPQSGDFKLIALAGMGGSGTACDVIADWLRPILEIPVIVVKDYHFPKSVNERTFALLTSLSGETEEVLSLLKEAVERGSTAASVSSGGRVMEVSRVCGIPHTRVERLLVPRASFPGLLYVSIRILKETGILHGLDHEVSESVSAMTKAIAESLPSLEFEKNPAKKTASFLYGFMPVVYSATKWASAAYRFQKSMNENAKVAVQVELFPELFHNEIETWTKDTKRRLVILRNERAEEREIKEKLEYVKSLGEKHGGGVVEIRSEGGLLSSLVRWICYVDMISLYVAFLGKREPLGTPRIDELKTLSNR